MSSGLCDVIWSTADKGAAVEPKDFSCVNRHLRNIKYAEGHSRVAIWKICMYDMGVLGVQNPKFYKLYDKKSDENQFKLH